MMHYGPLLLLAAVASFGRAQAQEPALSCDEWNEWRVRAEGVFIEWDQEPEVVGGLPALMASLVLPPSEQFVEGDLYVQFVVDTTGATRCIEVARGVSPAMDSAAVDAVRRSVWIPVTSGGRRVERNVVLPFRFRQAHPSDDPAEARRRAIWAGVMAGVVVGVVSVVTALLE